MFGVARVVSFLFGGVGNVLLYFAQVAWSDLYDLVRFAEKVVDGRRGAQLLLARRAS